MCLNCGCHQTPQWRCGPLGPRTLCNACGVRYKKDLPLNCWPIRDGMVLPPVRACAAGWLLKELLLMLCAAAVVCCCAECVSACRSPSGRLTE